MPHTAVRVFGSKITATLAGGGYFFALCISSRINRITIKAIRYSIGNTPFLIGSNRRAALVLFPKAFRLTGNKKALCVWLHTARQSQILQCHICIVKLLKSLRNNPSFLRLFVLTIAKIYLIIQIDVTRLVRRWA